MDHSPRPWVGNLPAERADSFVGRETLASAVEQHLLDGRMVTLTGVGGVGKTSLALHIARSVAHNYPHGAWLVDLTTIHDKSLVMSAIATTLQLHSYAESGMQEVLLGHLCPRSTLIVIDTCEHLIDSVAAAATTMLDAAPGLRILATSRQALGIDDEQVVVVPPLSTPPASAEQDAESLANSPYDAVQLLVRRTQQLGVPDFGETANPALVARLCRRLDGIPLAIVMASARIYSLGLEGVLEQLDDRFSVLSAARRNIPHHHHSLWDCLAWSHDLCSPAERVLWARLGVFAGPFGAADAVSVCSDGDDHTISGQRTSDLLENLIRQSIVSVSHDHDRSAQYYMLDVVRQFGLTRLEALHGSDTAIWRHRHAQHYQRMAHRAATGRFVSADGRVAPSMDLAAVRMAMPNFRAAIDWCLNRNDPGQLGLAITVALSEAAAWFVAAGTAEGRRYLERALAKPKPQNTTNLLRVRATAQVAWYSVLQNDGSGEKWLQLCRRETEGLGEIAGAFTAWTEGIYLAFVEQSDDSIFALENARTTFRQADLPGYAHLAGLYLAQAALHFGGVRAADQASRECVEYAESRCDAHAASWARWVRGLFELQHDSTARANKLFKAAVRTQLDRGTLWGTEWMVDAVALIAALDGKHTLAAELLGGAQRLQTLSGHGGAQTEPFTAPKREAERVAREYLGPELFAAAFQRGTTRTYAEALSLALKDTIEHTAPGLIPKQNTGGSNALTPRQQEVVQLIAEGLTSKDVGERLRIATRTVEKHVQDVKDKHGLTNRAQLVAWYLRWLRANANDARAGMH